jgi:hypothetical protein
MKLIADDNFFNESEKKKGFEKKEKKISYSYFVYPTCSIVFFISEQSVLGLVPIHSVALST